MLRQRLDPDPVRRERAKAGPLPSCTSERARQPIRARARERDHLTRCPKVARNGDRPWLNGTRRAPPGEVSSEWASVQECPPNVLTYSREIRRRPRTAA